MLKYLPLVCLLATLTTLTACKTMEERQADFAVANDYFIDKSSDELVLKRGVPSATFTLSTGERVFEYKKSARHTSGGYSYPVVTPTRVDGKTINIASERVVPATSFVSSCRLAFTVSTQNIVTSWRGNGNGCF